LDHSRHFKIISVYVIQKAGIGCGIGIAVKAGVAVAPPPSVRHRESAANFLRRRAAQQDAVYRQTRPVKIRRDTGKSFIVLIN
jgi:hypothetical protein